MQLFSRDFGELYDEHISCAILRVVRWMGVQSSVGAREQIDCPIKGEGVGKRTKAMGPTFIAVEPNYNAKFSVLCVL